MINQAVIATCPDPADLMISVCQLLQVHVAVHQWIVERLGHPLG
ncbi:hypothetical protein [Dethiosulfatarculus sandiegensis]|nr:hypothetical protein [Dethiosulfatarculus sandiegensis]